MRVRDDRQKGIPFGTLTLYQKKGNGYAMGIDPKDSRFGPLLPLDRTSLKSDSN